MHESGSTGAPGKRSIPGSCPREESRKRSARKLVGPAACSVDTVPEGAVWLEFRDACHDMRQPLSAMRALLHLAAIEAENPARVRHRIQQISNELHISRRTESRVLDAEPWLLSQVDVVEVARSAADAANLAFGMPGGPVSTELPEQLVACADGFWLRRAIANLLDNALRAAGPRGQVRLGLEKTAEGLGITVEDSGPGLGEEIGGGFSLGLQLVLRAAFLHGGYVVHGHSDRLGGALFRVVLPMLM